MIIENLDKYRIILASRSPRRQQLLGDLGLKFDVIVKEFDETYPEILKGNEIALFVAESKAGSFRNEISDKDIVITADTIVWCNDQVLGKPSGREDAIRMISELSGNTHEVITAVCLFSNFKKRSFSDSTKVTFEHLTEDEITFYVDKYRPYDKAGAYGIQEWIGVAACSNIEGSYFNVVGLPVQRLYKELREFI